MHKCWEVILEMETTELILKRAHPTDSSHVLKTPDPTFSFLHSISPHLTHPWGCKNTRMYQSPPKVPTSARWELESVDKDVAHIFTSHKLCLCICDSDITGVLLASPINKICQINL